MQTDGNLAPLIFHSLPGIELQAFYRDGSSLLYLESHVDPVNMVRAGATRL